MANRQDWSVLLTGAATIWLLIALGWALASEARPVDALVIALAFVLQLTVVMAWDLLPRLPLWLVAGHALIMLSLTVGLVITVPAAQFGAGQAGVPFHVVGLVPAGLAMLLAAWLRWERSEALVH
jgi:hypothetical protein